MNAPSWQELKDSPTLLTRTAKYALHRYRFHAAETTGDQQKWVHRDDPNLWVMLPMTHAITDYPLQRRIAERCRQSDKRERRRTVPETQKVSLILDSPVFRDLASAQRGNGRTWLDLLPITAACPTVDKIYIPSIVADWELRGKVAYNRADGSVGYHQVDPLFTDMNSRIGTDIAAIDALLSTASRWRLDKNGNGHLIPGENPKFVIYETPAAREFAKTALAIHQDDTIPLSTKHLQYQQLCLQKGKDLGEHEMEILGHQMERNGPVYLITNDMPFLSHHKHHQNKAGYPIGDATLATLLRADIGARAPHIAKELEAAHGTPVGELTFAKVEQDIIANGRYTKAPRMPSFSRPGFCTTPDGEQPGEELSSIFSRGAEIENSAMPKVTLPASSTRRDEPQQSMRTRQRDRAQRSTPFNDNTAIRM